MWPTIAIHGKCPRQKFQCIFDTDSDHQISDSQRLHRQNSIDSVFKTTEYKYYECSRWLKSSHWYETDPRHVAALAVPSHAEIEGLRKRQFEKRIMAWRRCLRHVYQNEL